jgi:hypothetical protein
VILIRLVSSNSYCRSDWQGCTNITTAQLLVASNFDKTLSFAWVMVIKFDIIVQYEGVQTGPATLPRYKLKCKF